MARSASRSGRRSAKSEWEDNPFDGDVPEDIARVIALANAALPDSDPRKITREKLKTMRTAAISFRVGDVETMQDDDATATLHQFADALASYLPPEEP